MAQFRAETVFDQASGKYYVELFYPADAVDPMTRTDPIYPTPEIAEQETIRLLKDALPEQPIKKI